jgi:hypothetical protein
VLHNHGPSGGEFDSSLEDEFVNLNSEFSLVRAFHFSLLDSFEVDLAGSRGAVYEVIVSVPTNEVDSTGAEDYVEGAANVAVVEGF